MKRLHLIRSQEIDGIGFNEADIAPFGDVPSYDPSAVGRLPTTLNLTFISGRLDSVDFSRGPGKSLIVSERVKHYLADRYGEISALVPIHVNGSSDVFSWAWVLFHIEEIRQRRPDSSRLDLSPGAYTYNEGVIEQLDLAVSSTSPSQWMCIEDADVPDNFFGMCQAGKWSGLEFLLQWPIE